MEKCQPARKKRKVTKEDGEKGKRRYKTACQHKSQRKDNTKEKE